MSYSRLRRRDFLRSGSLAAVGALAKLLTSSGCVSRPEGEFRKRRAVLWVGGVAHDFDTFAEIMTGFLAERSQMDIEVVRDGSFLDAPQARVPDVIIMNHCFEAADGVLTQSQKRGLLEIIRGGVGVVAIHASYYSFGEWDEFREVFGAAFVRHGDVDVVIEVRVTDANHAITEELAGSFELHSELYQSTPLADDCHLLAVAKEKGTEHEYPSVWTRNYGNGRIVTILPAHWPDSYHSVHFQKLIVEGVRWTIPPLQ